MAMVSVIMNAYNSEKYIREAVQSVLKQTFTDFELLVYDNQSNDGTMQVLRGFSDERLRYYKADFHTTLGQARNAAISRATGKYLAFLDSDDRLPPNSLQIRVDRLSGDANASFLYGNYYVIDANGRRLKTGLKGKQPSGDAFLPFLLHYPVNLQTVLLSREELLADGIEFNPELEVSEEFDLFMRFIRGKRVIYIPEALAEYRIHNCMTSVTSHALYPIENKRILEMLLRLEPNLDSEHVEVCNAYRAKIAYWNARTAFFNDECLRARGFLWPFRFHKATYYFLYLLTFLPSKFFRRIYRLRYSLG